MLRDPDTRTRLYRCPRCRRVAPWTDGTVEALGDEQDEFWCQTCGEETPLTQMRMVAPSKHHGQEPSDD